MLCPYFGLRNTAAVTKKDHHRPTGGGAEMQKAQHPVWMVAGRLVWNVGFCVPVCFAADYQFVLSTVALPPLWMKTMPCPSLHWCAAMTWRPEVSEPIVAGGGTDAGVEAALSATAFPP
jgi:hypothetical protein